MSRGEESSSTLQLPIYNYRDAILKSLNEYSTTIIVGETGCGKSTQLPQYIADYYLSTKSLGDNYVNENKIEKGQRIKNKKRKHSDSFSQESSDRQERHKNLVVCTQPRRVAAVTIAQKVATERKRANSKGGHPNNSNHVVGKGTCDVGYAIRFEDCTNQHTVIKYATDGVLLREIINDPLLSRYRVVILDEAHERSLQTDILMGLLRQLQEKRSELRVVVMSATLQVDTFVNYFKNSNVIRIPGRQFPVEILYTREPEADYIDATMLACIQIHEEQEPGDVLVFLPGQDDIESLQQLLQQHLTASSKERSAQPIQTEQDNSIVKTINNTTSEPSEVVDILDFDDFVIYPLYAAMPPDEQLKVFQPSPKGKRKFVLSTNVAETSVTISGIKYVVDSGYVKMRLLNAVTGVEMLKVVAVSKSQANQRAGRAGRESAGKCFRLYTEDYFDTELIEDTPPEIERTNIAQVVLQLKLLGVGMIDLFPFVTPPSTLALRKAFELLLSLDALQSDQSLTAHGRQMASLPLDPIFANLLLKSPHYKCVSEVLTAVSMLSSENVFLQPHRDADKTAAAQAHKNFASHDGDLPTLVSIYDSWMKTNKDKKWATRNFLSVRALQHAFSVREQLEALVRSSGSLRGSLDPSLSCSPEREPFLRCLLAGMFLNIARRADNNNNNNNNNNLSNGSSVSSKVSTVSGSSRFSFSQPTSAASSSSSAYGAAILARSGANTPAPYQTMRGRQMVHLHPSSVLFSSRHFYHYEESDDNNSNSSSNGNGSGSISNVKKARKDRLPQVVVFAELLVTSKQYMRTMAVLQQSWLQEELSPQQLQLLR